MLEIVQMPLARRLWRISKLFRLPLNDPRIQEMTPYDLEFYELSAIADDPKKLEQLQNRYYDPEFDDWLEEFDIEQSLEGDAQFDNLNDLDMPDEEDIRWANSKQNSDNLDILDDEEYDMPAEISEDMSDWEEVE